MKKLNAGLDYMVNKGRSQFVLIRGSSGTGKSSLIQHVVTCRAEFLAAHNVSFFSSKLDQFQRQPLSSLKQIVNQLLIQVLTMSTLEIGAWKAKVLKTLNGQGSLLINLFPLLEQIIGPQKLLETLPAQETQQRLNSLLISFFASFSSSKRPLILLFDDIQCK